ncbi:restriction endonuclease subunit S [Chryseobacterium balustinum]|uniref:Type I restriction enzyme, S subunit n=1 Tax=Chryseobacterium balustinum TaxID=246 RepID=A0ABY1LBV0_9FLAO|nr:restriction endonuclease subunit S [Chryseobacterium balustinum]AZB32147.1 restriction endonuclease subunit S [Chryseobacterium balustinum]SKB93758.1 type I restriction enzyme, S subunit [Chryseobacterium balustinum]
MEKVRLSELCKMQSGGTPSRSNSQFWDNGNIPWAKISDLETSDDGFIYDTEEVITEEGLRSINNRFFKKDTLLLAMYGSVGKTAITKIDLTTNQAILGINVVDESRLFLKFLKYWFSTIKEQLLKRAVGVALQNISLGIVKDLEIPLPTLPIQKAIAAKLDKAQEIISYNKQLLEKYDQLTQSLFIDMFGDPVRNEKGWEKDVMKNVSLKIGSGATPRGGRESYQLEGIALIRSMNIYDNKFYYKDLAFITDKQAEKLKNVVVKENDVLFNITGASVCRSTVVPKNILPARVNQHVSILRPRPEILHYKFLSQLLISKIVKNQLLKIGAGGGAVMEAITKEQLEKFQIILPPISLQNQFAERIEKIEAQKQMAQESLAKSEALFQSLLQESFK